MFQRAQQNDVPRELGSLNFPRRFRRLRIKDSSIEIETMIFRDELRGLKPLVILSPLEFPMPPSVQFCEQMWAAGYQVIFFRRPGLGRAPGLPNALLTPKAVKERAAMAAEAAIFKQLIDQMGLENYVLMGIGTSNSVCYRIAQLSSNVSYSIYSNPLFHPAIWDVIRPPWLRKMIRQTIQSKSGMQIAVRGLRAVLRRDPIWFYTQFAQKSDGDIAYIHDNISDFQRAGLMLQKMKPEIYFYNLQTALVEDTKWDPSFTRTLNATILSGAETLDAWKKDIVNEADRLGLPIEFAGSGDLFVPYASPDTLLKILKAVSAPVPVSD